LTRKAAELLKDRHAWAPGVKSLALLVYTAIQAAAFFDGSTQESENFFSVMMFGGKPVVSCLDQRVRYPEATSNPSMPKNKIEQTYKTA